MGSVLRALAKARFLDEESAQGYEGFKPASRGTSARRTAAIDNMVPSIGDPFENPFIAIAHREMIFRRHLEELQGNKQGLQGRSVCVGEFSVLLLHKLAWVVAA